MQYATLFQSHVTYVSYPTQCYFGQIGFFFFLKKKTSTYFKSRSSTNYKQFQSFMSKYNSTLNYFGKKIIAKN